jgi:hypothetical protein
MSERGSESPPRGKDRSPSSTRSYTPDNVFPPIKTEPESPGLFVTQPKPTPEAVIRSIFGKTPEPSELSSPEPSPRASPEPDSPAIVNPSIRRSDRLKKPHNRTMAPNPPRKVLENGIYVFKGSQGETVDPGVVPYDTRPSKAPEYETLRKLLEAGKYPSNEQWWIFRRKYGYIAKVLNEKYWALAYRSSIPPPQTEHFATFVPQQNALIQQQPPVQQQQSMHQPTQQHVQPQQFPQSSVQEMPGHAQLHEQPVQGQQSVPFVQTHSVHVQEPSHTQQFAQHTVRGSIQPQQFIQEPAQKQFTQQQQYQPEPQEHTFKQESPAPQDGILPRSTFQFVTFYQTSTLEGPYPLAINVSLREAYMVERWRKEEARRHRGHRSSNSGNQLHHSSSQRYRSRSPRSFHDSSPIGRYDGATPDAEERSHSSGN